MRAEKYKRAKIATALNRTERQVQEDLRKVRARAREQWCEECARTGQLVTATRHTIHPDFKDYMLCDECAEDKNHRWIEITRTARNGVSEPVIAD